MWQWKSMKGIFIQYLAIMCINLTHYPYSITISPLVQIFTDKGDLIFKYIKRFFIISWKMVIIEGGWNDGHLDNMIRLLTKTINTPFQKIIRKKLNNCIYQMFKYISLCEFVSLLNRDKMIWMAWEGEVTIY